jgi:hypothetical protein
MKTILNPSNRSWMNAYIFGQAWILLCKVSLEIEPTPESIYPYWKDEKMCPKRTSYVSIDEVSYRRR